jgi:tetratricopeptide (TPR) repeat protein
MALKEKLIDKAQKLIQKGYLDKAIVEYRAAADADPKDISIRLRIGDLYVKLGKKNEAVKEYNEAAKANAQRGFYLKAIAVYKQVLKIEENLETHNKLAELYLKQRLIADAVGEYSYIVNWYETRGKTNEVLELLKKMVDIDPENIGVRLKLADLYQKLSFGKDCLAEYAIIFEKLISAGKLDKAEKIYLSLYNAHPSDERILTGLSELYRLKGDDIQRLKFLKGLLNYYSGASMTEDARRAAQDIIRIHPDDPHASKFLKKEEKVELQVGKAPSGTEALSVASSIEVPVEAVEENAAEEPVASWSEEEIEITIEGFEEGSAESKAEGAPVPAPLLEASIQAPQPDLPQAVEAGGSMDADGASIEPPVQASQTGAADEIEIDIDDLMRGDLPTGAAEEPIPSEPPAKVPGAQFITPGVYVEEAARVEQKSAPSVPEVQVDEIVEDSGIEEAISVLSAELQEDLDASSTQAAHILAEAPVEEAPQPVIHADEIVEAVEQLEAVEPVTAEHAAVHEEALQGAAEPEPIVEIELELEPRIDILEPHSQTLESKDAPPEAVEANETAEARAAADEGGTIELLDIRPGQSHEESVSATSVVEAPVESSESLEAAHSPVEVRTAEPVIEIKEEPVEAPAPAEEEELQEDLSSAIQELMEKMGPDEAEAPPEALVADTAAPEADYVDLSAELGMEEASEDLAGSWGGKESAETFDEFKDGIGNQLNKEDSETHYNLGIAYMEMELHSEASKEFKIALKDARLELDCFTRLGLCAMAENNPDEAAAYYSKGLKAAVRSDEEKKALMYELALAYEASGRDEEANDLFREIFVMDPDFRETASKVSSYVFMRPMVPLDDGFIEVELL